MYKIAVWHNSGKDITFYENEKDAKEFVKLNRDSHMEIYHDDKKICGIHTLLPYNWIDNLDFSDNSYTEF